MTCANHPDVEASGVCSRCGKALCGECMVSIRAKPWCRSCLERAVDRETAHVPALAWPSPLAAGLLSLIPGVGHMYLGLIGKGFALMGLLISSIFLVVLYSDATGMYWVTAYLVPTLSILLLCYAVFDSLAIAAAMRAGKDPPADPTMTAVTERVLLGGRTVGWIVLIAGLLGILSVLQRILGLILPNLGINLSVTAVVVPVVLIVLGARMLWKGRR